MKRNIILAIIILVLILILSLFQALKPTWGISNIILCYIIGFNYDKIRDWLFNE